MIPFEKQEEIARKEVAIDIERFKRKSGWAVIVGLLAFVAGIVVLILSPHWTISGFTAAIAGIVLIVAIHDAIMWRSFVKDYESNIEHHVLCYLTDYPGKDEL